MITPALLQAINIKKSFGGLSVMKDVSITVREGEIIGLMGPNGAGKTTFFNIISSFCPPDSGQILYQGKDISGNKPHQSSLLGIGRTFQIVKPFGNLTVLGNVMVGAFKNTANFTEAKAKSLAIIERFGLGPKKDYLGHHLTLPDKKRLEVLRVLATEPKLMLLDEVMSGLTPGEIDIFLAFIREIRDQGVSIVVVEHVLHAIMDISDRIYVLNEGHIIAEGTPQEISINGDVIEAYLGEDYLYA